MKKHRFGYEIPGSPRVTETLERRAEPALGLPDGVDQLEADAALPAPNEVISLIVHEILDYRNVSCDGARG